MLSPSETGARAEQAAAAYLEQQGFRTLARNVRTPFGELDLVCQDGDVLVFVEVRYRASKAFGAPEETVAGQKLERIRQSAEWYVSAHGVAGQYRIDVVGLTSADATAVTHLRNVE